MPSVGSSLDDWLARLETFSPAEIDLGLERVDALLARLDLALPATVLHVAGTNGKGSTVAMLEALLRRTPARVGSYTSPHILRYNERVRLDGCEASDASIVAAFERIEALRGDVPLTYFEYGTLAALVVFAEAGVDIAILEVGMGGRLDAVNAVEPTAGIITNIALDHCEWLGPDVETIGAEKAGIMRAGKPVVFASRTVPASIVAAAKAVGAGLVLAGRDYDWSEAGDGWTWTGAGTRLDALRPPALAGRIQLQNAAGVLALLEASGFSSLLQRELVNDALAELTLRGRMQTLSAGGSWLLDVAHNPAAATVLAAALRELPIAGPTVAIIGVLDDKDVELIATTLDPGIDDWITVSAASPRAIPGPELARRIANACNRPCLVGESFAAAIDEARRRAGADGRVLVTGSFYVVGPVLEALELYSPR